jgi:PAS domain S-box-containing protein
MVYDLVTFRQSLGRNLETQAKIIAQNSTAALAYQNENDARDVLESLQAEPHIVMAALYDAHGNLFVKYPTNISVPATLTSTALRARRFERTHLTLFEPVVQSNTRMGTLYLQSDLTAISTRLKLYGGISALILTGSLLVVFWLSNTLQRRISTPIVALAETARKISGKQDFSVRAQKSSDDEIGDLTDAFNSMLDQIQTSHSELKKSREHLQVVADHAFVLLCQIDREHRLNFVNRAYADRYDMEPHDMLGRHVREITGDEAYKIFQPQLDKAFVGRRVEFEMEVPYEKFGPRWVHVVYMPERNIAGEVVALVAVINDITERKRAEQELERARDEAIAASRAKDDFLAALSHELRTPLNPVLLLSSEASTNETLPPEVRQIFDTISKNVSLEARLIDDLLDLTRITRNKLSLEMQPTDVHAAIQNALETVRADVEFKDIALTLKLNAEKCLIMGDAVRLQQIFWNVLKNAMKFTPPSGKIFVQTQNTEDCVVIQITDTGIGMTPDEVSRVFSAFAQGDHAMGGGSHRFGGLGLGLAITQKLVQLHSGKIEAHSGGRDQGATLTIELPLIMASELKSLETATPVSPPAVSVSSPGRRILLVEDHEPTRLALAHLLTRRRFEVLDAGTVADARDMAAKGKIDFVISDIGLPDGNGYALMAELRDTYQLKGIALTGYGMEEDVTRGRSAGFITHLTKPVHIHALETALALVDIPSES